MISPKLLYKAHDLYNSKNIYCSTPLIKSSSKNNFSKKNIKYCNSKISLLEINKKISSEDNINKIEKNNNKNIRKIEKFNNELNLKKCSELLKTAIDNEKKLILIKYIKKKEKINKSFNTIGEANGIAYPNITVLKGQESNGKNFLRVIRNFIMDRKCYSTKNNSKFII